uniref:2Fe-2S iron-sulfur cluster binding domain-containing protein n=1 Tax=Candidatus Kentrum sp. LFY TaxID=2126342 RepID=A0A450X3S0_9GAMM|nr:MAG: 2Fe-2S iron-sulfur cluster binding domain-containing protein [Candidatus Kentron sp. LFY]VFJ93995.1 MAG: 2Fe-2S iron-sulfur cluster binding domain-containing protein [Candidatus Kentron sp. LFY]VFK23870.1 MAG: 2Fe-2S iron-sulfur cluster binding domain-containing protein [Candidatus Kentron sp. LFY]
MIDFILNDRDVRASAPPGGVVLDFLRRSQRLAGIKEGCREGDCGACLVLVGEWSGDTVLYRPINSCLLPLAEIEGKHVITIEGPNDRGEGTPNPIRQAIVDEGATQCGYCTPGIILALTGFFLGNTRFEEKQAMAALGGNICRCTGYQSIKRAAARLCAIFPPSDLEDNKMPVGPLVEKGIVPPYFLQIPGRLRRLSVPDKSSIEISPRNTIVGGGTDLWVQRPDDLYEGDFTCVSRQRDLKGIRIENGHCHIGTATTFQEMEDSPVMRDPFPNIPKYFERIASRPIRYRATVGGNIVNASPIG